MGIAASQARYLYLTARQINIEFEGQQINQARTVLANEEAGLTTELAELDVPYQQSWYTVKSNCDNWGTEGPNPDDKTTYPGGEKDPQYIKDKEQWDAYMAAGQGEDGYTAAYNVATTQYTNDKTEYDKASDEIQAKSETLQQQDQVLELKLRQLDTERETITNELESVKKVLDKNIENVFKTFQS